MWKGIGAGFAVVALSGLLAFLLLRWALGKDPAFFVKVFLGGVLVRLVLVGAAAFSILAYTHVHRVAFAGSLIGSYLIFLAGEAFVIQKLIRDDRKKGGGEVGNGERC